MIVSAGFHFTAGQAKAVASLADYLARLGTQVHLVGNKFDPGLASRPGVTAHRVASIRGEDAVGNVLLARAGLAVARAVTRDRPGTRVVVNGGNCVWADVNWVHYLHAAFIPDLSAAPLWYRTKARVVDHWNRQRERRAIRSAGLILTNSDRTRDDVIRHIGVPATRVRTVYCGADPSWASPSEDERRRGRMLFDLRASRPVVSFIGGLGYDNRKGFDTLLESWAQLCQSPEWDADLVMAGGGRATAAVANRVVRERLADRVRLVGFTDRVFELLAASDLLVSPVRYEPYGLNVQEAICRGVPALVSASAGVAEEYPPELSAMLLSNPEDAGELADRLRAWRTDVSAWKVRFGPMSDRLRSRTWDDMAREIVAAVSSTLPTRPAGAIEAPANEGKSDGTSLECRR